MTRLIVVVDSPPHVADALAAGRATDARIVEGWSGGPGDICVGTVSAPEDAAAALLAAVAGAGLVVSVAGSNELTDRLCDDLRRIGPLEVLTPSSRRRPMRTRIERGLLELLAGGSTLGDAATKLDLPRRTADRRLADARAKLGVETTAEAIISFARLRA